jgi:exonuclease III
VTVSILYVRVHLCSILAILVAFNVEGENLTSQNVKFPNLSFAAQNVLSLNVSTKNSKTDLKILAVTKNNVDVVILSDTRLNTDKQSASIHDLTKKFLFRGYNFIHNSKSASRGVAILIKKTLDWEIHRKKAHIGDNYLLLDITIMKKRFTLAAVYGPNNDDLRSMIHLRETFLV